MSGRAEIVVCGAGAAGVAAAYRLAARHRARGVVLVDPREPLTLTGGSSTAGYRDGFGVGDPDLARFLDRSIDLLESLALESGGSVRMHRRGWVLPARDRARLEALARSAEESAARGGGPLRRHPGPAPYAPADPVEWDGEPRGADLIEDPALIARAWPYLAKDVAGALHLRRAGCFDAWGAGQWMRMCAARAGVEVRRDEVIAIDAPGGRVRAARLASGGFIETAHVVLAAGARLPRAARMLGLELPLACELRVTLALAGTADALPREAPLLICGDPVELERPAGDRRARETDADAAAWLRPSPAGVHVQSRERPRELLLTWTDGAAPAEPERPQQGDVREREAALGAAVRMIPALRAHAGRAAEGAVEAGGCCRTPEHRPLAGPLPVEGAWVIGALSDFGIMGCHAAADLLAAHLLGMPLPEYAAAFAPPRDADAARATHGGSEPR